MPRDASGNYTLPLGNPVVAGTVIEDTWANPTMNDVATQLNNVLTRDGVLGPILPFKVIPGAVGAPGLAFSTAPNSGMYLEADRISFSWLGIRKFGVLANSVVFNVVPQYDTLPVNPTDLANKQYVDNSVAQATPGLVPLNPVDWSVNYTIALADWGTGVIRITSAIAITLPTVATMGLPATPGKLRTMAFMIYGAGVPTFAGAAGVTINGVAGTTITAPLGGAPRQYQYLVLTQMGVGSNSWTLQ